METEGPGRASQMSLTPMEEEHLRQIAARPNIHEVIAKSIAPSIYGGLGECLDTTTTNLYRNESSLFRRTPLY